VDDGIGSAEPVIVPALTVAVGAGAKVICRMPAPDSCPRRPSVLAH